MEETLERAIVVDLLPSGFEIVPYSLSAGCAEVREDRILFHCSLGPQVTAFTYCLQAVNKGLYTVPPIFAKDLYNEKIQAQGASGRLEVD